MQPLSAPLTRSVWESFYLWLVSAVALISAATLGGWWLQIDELLQPLGVFAPLNLNAAIGFGVLSAALFAVEFGHRRLAAISTIATVIGGSTLIEHFSGRDLHIDQLFGVERFFVPTAHPGRMGIVVAACLVLSSLVLLWRTTNWGQRTRLFVEAVVGSVLASAGLSTFLATGADLASVSKWASAIETAPVAAIGIILLGLTIVLLAWRENMKVNEDAPAWSAVPPMILCLTVTMILWVGMQGREQAHTTQHMRTQMDEFAIQSRDLLDQKVSQFERMAHVSGDTPGITGWHAETMRQLSQGSTSLGCLSITLLDRLHRTIWVHPQGINDTPGFNAAVVEERPIALQRAAAGGRRTGVFMGVPVVGPKGAEKGFVIYTAVMAGSETVGYVTADFSYRKFFEHIAKGRAKIDEGYHVSVSIGDVTAFENAGVADATPAHFTTQRTYTFADQRMRVNLSASNSALPQSRRYLPELALAAGIGITVLLGLSVHLARRAHAGQRAAELSNRKLFAENEERRRIEDRLKISDERLRLALDSTQIGIFEWSVMAGQVYYSPGLWAMLGYEHSRMPSTVEAWQSLIHPDDLHLYRRRTESQLNGITPFIEPEYRVRARRGEWRWIYARSKSVATNADGCPTRILGTVQDITARRGAEVALRESQAEARKLSLVAAKTDNPVLIGGADGRIEWANEAFCRVMEYRLEEVVGKNPFHFLIGPETNLRTVSRIRTAVAQGVGISTDIVNYSKSGRKYHLHVELQAVRSEAGIENFIAVETDITARVETETQLRRAKAEADDASLAKSEFLASMSHEIRTPMNGVIGMTSLLLETPLSNEQRDYVSTMRTSGEALLTIINDILDFSKIESGKMELERSPFELSLCLEEALDLFAMQASAKNLEIGYYIAPDVPTWIIGDVTRVRQVVVNLVNNAVKFTPSGSVSVEVRRCVRQAPPLGFDPALVTDPLHTVLEITVRDTGIGIPADRMDRLFKAFSQIDSSTTRKYGGTGLGLAISQRLCQLMGGDIHAECNPGRGSAFVFTIETTVAPACSDSGLSTTPEALRGGWVLCVEDHPVTQARLRSMIGTWGVECVVVPNMRAAIEATANHAKKPALLVIDAGELGTSTTDADALASIKCPRMVLFPFGQAAPLPLGDGLPFASTSKPIRTISFVVGIISLFQSAAHNALSLSNCSDRLVGEEIPLEVLLAEDNAVNQKVALRFLERLGYRADAVANGLEAVTTLEHRRYDLVLMDLQMPEMDGFEATRQIRMRLPAGRQPKIIALTANAMQGDRELCVAAGMDDYISKPVKIQEIAATIRRQFVKPTKNAPTAQLIG
jgi:PAS domain S-box-containing protein